MADTQNNRLTTVIGLGLLALAAVGLLVFACNTQDPLDGQAPDIIGYLSEERDLCESRAQALQRGGIDGRGQYESVQAAANGCIGHLQGVLAQGSGNKNAIGAQLSRVESESLQFRNWADQRLGQRGAGALAVDPLALATAVLKLLDGQEQARRKAVQDALGNCRFRSWEDIRARR